jgi:hypothetical protein
VAFSLAVGTVLRQSVRDHDWQQPIAGLDRLNDADLGQLPKAAAFHGVVGCVYHSIRGSRDVQPAVSDALEATYHRALFTHQKVLATLRQVAPVLDSLGVPWLVMKGPILAETIYPRPDLRGYTDLDLLVPGARLGRVIQALEESGGSVVDHNWALLTRQSAGEVHLVMNTDTIVDLHWDVVNDAAQRRAFALHSEQLFERTRRVALPGCMAPTLDAADTLIHLGLHACLSGADRLVWLKDLEQAIVRDAPPWDEVVQRSRTYATGVPLATMLVLAQKVLGTSVPDDVMGALAESRAWPRLVSGARRLTPIERSSGDRSVLRLTARATRESTWSSSTTLARHAARALRNPFRRLPPASSADPGDQVSPNHAAGTRAEYLQAVSLTSRS